MPAPATPEPKAPADTAGDDDGLLSARLAGALSGPVNGSALDDDFSELLAPEHKEPAPSDPASAAKPAEAGSDGKDPLWFLKQPSAAGESNGTQAPTARTQPGEAAPAAADEVKLSRPEVLRASLPPLFGAAEERPTIFRTAPAHAPKAPDSSVPAAKMQPLPPPPGEVGKTAAGSVHTARTQPSMPSAQPADETAKAAPPPSAPRARTDAGPSEAVPAAPVAREPAPIPEVVAPAPVAEAAPGPQPLPEAKPANGSLGDVAADTTANKAPTLTREPSATKRRRPPTPRRRARSSRWSASCWSRSSATGWRPTCRAWSRRWCATRWHAPLRPSAAPPRRDTASKSSNNLRRRFSREHAIRILMLEKTYQPADIEARIHAEWMKAEAFKAGRPERAKAEPYAIVIPPPNVTGSLHMGHALNNTLQDVLCRFERMRGKDVLWQPGTDHAGIATQMVVERQLMERQQPDRHTLGREKFIERVWAWKAESGGVIINQLKRLGASCDWSRERFTMDEGLSRAVLKVFVDLYNEGLIYKDKRLVNWDPVFQSALSDLEVEMIEVKGSLWHFKYPLKDDPARFIVVATTRPETMLGDTAVAVHPADERYKDLIGKKVVLPLVGREIPIIADEYANPEKGSGAVKITPAHDFNDYQVYKRHPEIGLINIFDATRASQRQRAGEISPARSVRRAQAGGCRSRGTGPGRDHRAAGPRRPARAARQRRHRAVADRSVVGRCGRAGETGGGGGRGGQDHIRPEELGEDLFRMDAQHPALVHLAPDLVGASDTGVVRTGRQGVRGAR